MYKCTQSTHKAHIKKKVYRTAGYYIGSIGIIQTKEVLYQARSYYTECQVMVQKVQF